MPNQGDPFDDGLGPDPLDRGSGKVMGGRDSSIGSYLDPSYEDALRIMGRADEMPPVHLQMPLFMGNAEGADLARRLTALRLAAGVDVGPFAGMPTTLGPPVVAASVGEAVTEFIVGLQESPLDRAKLAALRQQVEGAGAEVRAALERVCEHPAVRAKLEG